MDVISKLVNQPLKFKIDSSKFEESTSVKKLSNGRGKKSISSLKELPQVQNSPDSVAQLDCIMQENIVAGQYNTGSKYCLLIIRDFVSGHQIAEKECRIYDVSIICQPDRSRLVPVAWQQWSEMEALIPSPAACEVYGLNIMSKQMVRRWCRQFSEGRQSVHDEERSGRPSLINDDCVELVRQCIMENRRFTITELSSHFPQISRSLLHEIVTKHLLFKKVCARWVPKNLTPEHKMQCLGAALTFLQRYHDDGNEFLDRIVTGDETWISHFTLETKQQSMHWRQSGSPVRTKFKQTLSVRKVMCTVFWDRKDILLIDFLPRGETVNTDRYCGTLRKLRRAIQNKRRGMLTAGVVLLHDNAHPHKARRTAAGSCLINHPTVLTLLPAIFTFSCTSRNSCPPVSVLATTTSVTRWFHSQVAEFYDSGIQKLIP
ncbi:hypothetical protein ANN_06570 [Periplaneta americana]|uniref:Uncharacterized protein n=1 Tax=Periplaneta americana TaxID=6978 RepID=A0ABQ8TES1_PERAM|nr:hypothetical protein ANN_06570 [Periplaneta americana]